MSTLAQVVDNINTLSALVPLKNQDYQTIQKALSVYLGTGTLPCTGCRYCMDCPADVDIPAVFTIYNNCASQSGIPVSFGNDPAFLEKAKRFLSEYKTIPKGRQPSHCVYCEKCKEHCPQEINIPKHMREIAKLAESLKPNGSKCL
jgi:predicted aldo/keto reductase-like oxidoreductase